MTPVTGPPAHRLADLKGGELVPGSLVPRAPWPTRPVAVVSGSVGGDVLGLALVEGRARAARGQVGLPPSLAVVRGAMSSREGPEVPALRDWGPAHPVSEPPSDRLGGSAAPGLAPSRTQSQTGPGEGRLPPGPSGHLDGWWGVGGHTGVTHPPPMDPVLGPLRPSCCSSLG